MPARKPPTGLLLGLALIVVPFLVVIGLEAYEVFGHAPRMAQSREQVLHIFEVITTAHLLDRAVQDTERGQRGYLLTGDPAYLEPYQRGAHDAPLILAKLKELTADNAEQQERLRKLEEQLNAKLAELRSTVETHDREGFDAARRIVQTNTGLAAMLAIGSLIDSMIAAESALLTERQARLADEQKRVADTALVSGIVAFAAMLLGIALAVIALRNIQRAEHALHVSEQSFRLLADGVADHAIYTLDPMGNITDWNAGAERVKGYSADEVVGTHFSRFYTEEDRQAGVPRIALDTTARDGKFEDDGLRVRKDGTRFWANVTISPLRDPGGRLLGFAKITRDATAQRAQQLALDQARAALAQSQKMQALGQLSGGIAHDFNNLLHVIINGIEILQRRLPGAEQDIRQVLDMIKRNASRAGSLTQRMLAFSRQQPLEPKPISPNKLVGGMVDLLERALGESIDLETVLGSGTWVVSVDPNQLEAAILNLAVNARDALPNGGKLTIETTNAFLDETYAAAHGDVKSGQYAMIAVSDNGTGMNDKVRTRAFEPFFTTKEAGQGTGLGLSQVYGFIKQSGGHVKIYSEPGEGTTVKLYLPRLRAARAEETDRDLPRQVPASAPTEGILVVEDDEDVRAFTAEVLRELGYNVVSAPDARSALRELERDENIHLLFTDVGLPNGVNGRQLADEVQRRWPSMKVLFTTGYARNAIVHQGRLDPDVHLIVKPFTQSTLAQKIRQVLDETS